ncbi:DUF4174 domain-containing protein [Cyclobacterium plantarum]|uniref:DUF4174 domain-containing protein n=1 Tax=Cyclobacterium plantarum TaxID=2716263 RepID=A0ABX0H5C8_9BACT|nr:DUF4174 domain-containing protein [Cyclobacterium plantarum]NHE56727.1 DUF4174 domain-containing protein [Cyclobacterium plantarum]
MKFPIALLLVFAMKLDPSPITLEDLQWKHRVLLVFPGSDQNSEPGLEWTADLEKELLDRDLVYFLFADTLSGNNDYVFTPTYREKLEKKYRVGSKENTYVLIGKDGGVKLKREQQKIDWNELFKTIDAMPMRIREMRESGQNKDQ